MSTVQLIIRPVSCFVFLSAHTVCYFARGTLYLSTPLAETELRLRFLCEQDQICTREQDRRKFILSGNASLLTTHLQASSINHYKMTERAPVPFSPFLTSPIFHSEKLKAPLTHLSTSGTLKIPLCHIIIEIYTWFNFSELNHMCSGEQGDWLHKTMDPTGYHRCSNWQRHRDRIECFI